MTQTFCRYKICHCQRNKDLIQSKNNKLEENLGKRSLVGTCRICVVRTSPPPPFVNKKSRIWMNYDYQNNDFG